LIDPDAGRVNFGEYAATWIEERPGLRPKAIALYGYLLRGHLELTFGAVFVADIHEPNVRHWRKERLDAGGECCHRCEGVPAAESHPEHCHR